jgi:molecular chaperone GrpE
MNDQDQNNSKVKELEERVEEFENKWKRAVADYINFERRTIEEKKQMISWANEGLILNMLPVLDDLEKLDSHINDGGLKMILKNFKQILDKEGVKEIVPTGTEFDPNDMDAVDLVAGEKNKVIEVLTKGYMYKDNLLRPAKVKVGNGTKPTDVGKAPKEDN